MRRKSAQITAKKAPAMPPPAASELPTSPLLRLRLLIALDALLVEGSVTGAARALDIGVPAMSRLLAQLRSLYGDEIVVRLGRALVPTPFAEKLRARVRAVSSEASDLMQPKQEQVTDLQIPAARAASPIVQHPPLALAPTPTLEGQPDARIIAQRLGDIDRFAEPKQRLARAIAIVGAGVGQSRPLSADEAADAMKIILDGEADPIQIGALMVAMQYRGVTANELAGMVTAARRGCLPLDQGAPVADLDWPAYRSPRVTTPPWFLMAARLVAQAGYRVALHGVGRYAGPSYEVAIALGIPKAMSHAEATKTLEKTNIVFLPLVAVDAQLQALISLYRLFEMRSPLNLVVQLLNPLGAPATIVGVPSAAGRTLQRDAAAMLGWRRLLAIGSNRDVAQATPFQVTPLAFLDGEGQSETSLPALQPRLISPPRTGFSAAEYCAGLWSGSIRDEYAVETIVSTTAMALMAIPKSPLDYSGARERARQLWASRKLIST